MIVGGFSFAGTLSRPAAAATTAGPSSTSDSRESEAPVHFRSISAISPGSLAAAYQAIRAHESIVAPPIPAGEPAILSGLGIPGALAAYGEFAGED